MQTAKALFQLRQSHNLSQEALAQKVFVTRQAVSRWERGETLPSTQTLKLLHEAFGMPLHALLGQEERLLCQCCGMPLTRAEELSSQPDGACNPTYCKWCFDGGVFVYPSLESLLDFLVPHLAKLEHRPEHEVEHALKQLLPQLAHWQNET